MPDLPILEARAQHHEELVLVGLRVDPQHDGPQFYTLLAVGGDVERPPLADGRLLLFTRPQLVLPATTYSDTVTYTPLGNFLDATAGVAFQF